MSEEKKEVVVPEKFQSIISAIEGMSVLDLAELVKVLEAKFGVSAAPVTVAPTAAVGAGGAVGQAEAEAKSSFDVELTDAGGNKIAVIKVVREITGLGLADCKALVEGAPKTVKSGVKQAEAEEIKKKLEEAGAKVTLK